jgi:hypothetical protein
MANCAQRDTKTISHGHIIRASISRITQPKPMQTIDMKPGLNAWHMRRRRQRARWLHRAILCTGLIGLGLYAVPLHHNPLVQLGVLQGPPPPREIAIAQVRLAIPVRPVDLPKLRPSLNAARSADQIEAAHVVGVLPPIIIEPRILTVTAVPDDEHADLNQSGVGDTMLSSLIEPSPQPAATSALPAQRRIPAAASTIAKSSANTGGDEDLAAARKRVFTVDR